jgi:hypothetical protein
MTTPPPIACSLSVDAFADRLDWIARLNRECLREFRVDGRSLRLVYRAEAGQQIRELVEKEGECCGFLRFAIHETSDAIELRIDAPNVDGRNVEPLFAPFLSDARRLLRRHLVKGERRLVLLRAA